MTHPKENTFRSIRNKKKTWTDLVDSFINKLPIELHIPNYNYCGPGTKLINRLTKGQVGVNPLNDAYREHDIAYILQRTKIDTRPTKIYRTKLGNE